MRVSEFDTATQVADDGACEVFDGWDIGGNANGTAMEGLLGLKLMEMMDMKMLETLL